MDLDLFDGRQGSASRWTIPTTNPIYKGVYCLLVNSRDGRQPVGSAFCVSKLALLFTAMHNLWAAVESDWRGRQVRRQHEMPKHVDLAEVSLSVLWQDITTIRGQLMLWPLENVYAPLPTDIAVSTTQFQSTHPYLALPITFSWPSPGETVRCLGCLDPRAKDYTFRDEDLKSGSFLDRFSPRVSVVEARVTQVFTQHFAQGFVDGPCFLVDADLPHGMSGGPVLNEAGYVCGLVTAGAAEILGVPSGIVSLLYPAFAASVNLAVQLGPVRIKRTRLLFDLIGEGHIRTDGSETLVALQPEDGEHRIGMLGPPGGSQHVYDSFETFQAGLSPNMAKGIHYRMKYRDR